MECPDPLRDTRPISSTMANTISSQRLTSLYPNDDCLPAATLRPALGLPPTVSASSDAAWDRSSDTVETSTSTVPFTPDASFLSNASETYFDLSGTDVMHQDSGDIELWDAFQSSHASTKE